MAEQTQRPMDDPGVEAAFAAFPDDLRPGLLNLRELIFSVAEETPGVGRLTECLKWGEPSYQTSESRSGSPIRLSCGGENKRQIALYCHCGTNLVATFRSLFSDSFTYEGNRALVLKAGQAWPEAELRHCIGLALTYHARKKKA